MPSPDKTVNIGAPFKIEKIKNNIPITRINVFSLSVSWDTKNMIINRAVTKPLNEIIFLIIFPAR